MQDYSLDFLRSDHHGFGCYRCQSHRRVGPPLPKSRHFVQLCWVIFSVPLIDLFLATFVICTILTTFRYVANGSILSMAEKDWSFSFKINVDSMFLMSKAFLPNVCTLFALIRSATFCILKLNLTGYILDGEAEIWFDHQHVFRGFFNQGCAQQIRVWNNESCGHWDDQVYGG